MLAHNPRPLIFFRDTHVLNIKLDLKTTPFGKQPKVKTKCSQGQFDFMNAILKSARTTHENIRRLLSFPGFTQLLECDTFLARTYRVDTKQQFKMICPRVFKSSLRLCKQWALKNCKHISANEKIWLKTHSRSKRSNWACHAGLFGAIRKIYTTFGGSCNSDKLASLKKTLYDMTDLISTNHQLITTLNGKSIQLYRITDSLTNRINTLATELSKIDSTFTDWKGQLNKFGKEQKCHYDSVLEFSSRFSFEITNTFNSLLRFLELQDIFHQFSQIQGRELVGYNDIPVSLSSTISAKLQLQPQFRFTSKALADGFPILINPVTQFKHKDRYMSVDTLLTLPRIASKSAFCTIEYLTPLIYRVKNKCFSGPLTRNDLMLVSCINSKVVIKTDMLNKCFNKYGTLLCPETITRHSRDGSWLGIPWVPGSSMSFPRTHSITKCTPTDPILHLGGRFFLSTKTQQIRMSTGLLNMSPLAIYNIPCNSTSTDLPTGFGTCPYVLTIHLPIFRRKRVKFIPWTPENNNATLNLHYKSLGVLPPIHFNKNITKALDETYQRLDGHFSTQIRKVKAEIKKIHTVKGTSTPIIIASIAICLSVVNHVIFILWWFFNRKLRLRHPPHLVHYVKNTRPHSPHFTEQPEMELLQPPDNPSDQLQRSDSCPDCGNPPTIILSAIEEDHNIPDKESPSSIRPRN